MKNLFIFLITFYLCLISVIGYGFLFKKLCFNKFSKENYIYLGFYGLTILTIISLITSLIFSHNFTHNLIIHLLGVIFFLIYLKKKNFVFINHIFIISVLLFSLLIISKTNDDFSYYHLPFTKYLVENHVIFGMGHLNHGYNLISSLFYLNSLFYLPFIEFYSFHFTILYFLIFFNYFLVHEIYFNKHQILKYLYLFTFVYFNLSFNRLAEFGTDKIGQLLIVILVIKLLEYTCFKISEDRLNKILYLLPILGFCISLKTYFLPYLLFSLSLIIIKSEILFSLKRIFFSNTFIYFFLIISFVFVHHLIHTGCIISPLSLTCFGDQISWSRDTSDIKNLSLWLEQWAKGGAGPNFRVDNPLLYIQNLNWLNNWFSYYFIGKFSDQLLLLFISYILIFFIFKKISIFKSSSVKKSNFIFLYCILLVIFSLWFLYHPTLRYGGYSIVFLVISLPVVLLTNFFEEKKNFNNRFKLLIVFIVITINIKNFIRINDEIKREDIYKFSNFPFYAIKKTNYTKNIFDNKLVIYSSEGHCWLTPSPCGATNNNLIYYKKGNYNFIEVLK